jgi:glucosamine-6-phosphate deaminase
VVPPEHPERGDLAVLGLGTNGHVAFHEPGIPADFRFGEVKLHDDTAERLHLESGTVGRTYGIGIFNEAKALLLVVRGESKRRALQGLLEGDPNVPASALRDHPDLTILTDLA